MSIGCNLQARLRLAGYRLCNSCIETIEKIDERGPEWTAQHKQQLARLIHANLRRDRGKVPYDIRKLWVERQIELAIKQETL